MIQTPISLYKKRLEAGGIQPDEIQRSAVEALQGVYERACAFNAYFKKNWAKRVLSRKKPGLHENGLYLHGGVGRGKSMLMDLFFECLPEDMPKRRVHFHAFMLEVHAFLNAGSADKAALKSVDSSLPLLANKIFKEARVLCFDEFHVTDITDAMILGRLFTALFEKGIIVVVTTNWEPDRLYEGGLKRNRFLPFIDLLKARVQIFHLDSPTDYRAKCLMEQGSYFWPLGEATQQKITVLFAKLSDHAPPHEERLEVQGRQIIVNAVSKGAARFTFAQLCEQPLGAADYITIAQTYKTVFIEGIPKMGYDRRNEAKRFMTLIDTLYENKTKLIVSADALPDRLYYGHDYAYEFQRTASRLKEMQSSAYLA